MQLSPSSQTAYLSPRSSCSVDCAQLWEHVQPFPEFLDLDCLNNKCFMECMESLMENEASTARKKVNTFSHSCEDTEDTLEDFDPVESEEEHSYRAILRRIFIENMTAEKVIQTEVKLLGKINYPDSFDRVLLQTINKSSIIYRSILKEKICELLDHAHLRLDFPQKPENSYLSWIDLYQHFDDFIDLINIIADFNEAISAYGRELNTLLQHLVQHDMLRNSENYCEQNIHRQCFRIVLDDPLIKHITSMIKTLMTTNTFRSRLNTEGLASLEFIVECTQEEPDVIVENDEPRRRHRKKKKRGKLSVEELNQMLFEDPPAEKMPHGFSKAYLKEVGLRLVRLMRS